MSPGSRRLLLFLAALGAATALRAESQPTALADSSPFLPAGGAATGSAQDQTTFDLRGVMTTPSGPRYCIYDPAKKTSQWSGVNEGGHPFLIKSADLERETVTLQADGRLLTLGMHRARVAAMAATPAAVIGAGGPPPGAVNPAAPPDQAARMAALAAEIARRRALRQQAEQNPDAANGAGVPPPAGGDRRRARPQPPQ